MSIACASHRADTMPMRDDYNFMQYIMQDVWQRSPVIPVSEKESWRTYLMSISLMHTLKFYPIKPCALPWHPNLNCIALMNEENNDVINTNRPLIRILAWHRNLLSDKIDGLGANIISLIVPVADLACSHRQVVPYVSWMWYCFFTCPI